MKSILMSIKPKWVSKILNREKTIEVRKKFPSDYVGWVYIYCTKGNKKNWHLIEVIDTDTGWEGYEYDYYIGSKGYLSHCLEGKVVARFWCDNVKPNYHFYEEELCALSCLTDDELFKYLGYGDGYAIHISKLEIFNKPRYVSEFRKYSNVPHEYTDAIVKAFRKAFNDTTIPLTDQLKKAPQSWCYIEGEK